MAVDASRATIAANSPARPNKRSRAAWRCPAKPAISAVTVEVTTARYSATR